MRQKALVNRQDHICLQFIAHQIIKHQLQSQKCCCYDLRIVFTICFVWISVCIVPAKIITHWSMYVISFLQIMCMFVGIIGVWYAKRLYLRVAKYAMIFNMFVMMSEIVTRTWNLVNILRESKIARPPMKIPKFAVCILAAIFNIAVQTWMIVIIGRIFDKIDQIRSGKEPPFVV